MIGSFYDSSQSTQSSTPLGQNLRDIVQSAPSPTYPWTFTPTMQMNSSSPTFVNQKISFGSSLYQGKNPIDTPQITKPESSLCVSNTVTFTHTDQSNGLKITSSSAFSAPDKKRRIDNLDDLSEQSQNKKIKSNEKDSSKNIGGISIDRILC